MFAALLVTLAVVLHFVWGRALAPIAERLGGPRSWAWLPVLNLLLPLRLAGRSLFWGLLYLVPAVNFVVWALAWAEVCARLGRPNEVMLEAPAGGTRTRLVAVAAALAAAVPVLAVAHRVDVRRRLDRAVADLHGSDGEGRRRAAAAIGRAGVASPSAVDALAGALGDAEAPVRVEAARALGALGPAARAPAPALSAAAAGAPPVRGPAARALSRVEPAALAALPAEQAIPALLDEARGAVGLFPDVDLVQALAAPGRAAAAPLARALGDADSGVRWHAAAALMQLEGQGRAALPALLVAMNDEVWEVRNASGRALEEVVMAPDAPALAAALADPSSETRYHAARALARLGPGAAAALPALITALHDSDWEVRMESSWAVNAAGPRARAALPALVANLSDTEPGVRASAAWTIAAVGADAAAVDALRPLLRDPDGEVRRAASGALLRAGAR